MFDAWLSRHGWLGQTCIASIATRKTHKASPESGGGRHLATKRPAASGAGTVRPQRKRRRRAQPGLPATMAGLAGSAAHPRLPGKANPTPPRASAASAVRRLGRQIKGRHPGRSGRQKVLGRASSAATWRHAAERPRNRTHRPPAQAGAPAGRSKGVAPRRQRSARRRASSAPAHSGERSAPAPAIVTVRPRPALRGLGGEAFVRAIERARQRPADEAVLPFWPSGASLTGFSTGSGDIHQPPAPVRRRSDVGPATSVSRWLRPIAGRYALDRTGRRRSPRWLAPAANASLTRNSKMERSIRGSCGYSVVENRRCRKKSSSRRNGRILRAAEAIPLNR